MATVVVSASFDDPRAADFRFAEEAARRGELTVLLWSDAAVRALTGADPSFPQEERGYLVQAMRYVSRVVIVEDVSPDALPDLPGVSPDVWAMREAEATVARRSYCDAAGIACEAVPADALGAIPEAAVELAGAHPGRRRVVVTGCFDWFHSGHVAFFEEVSALGELYVVVGHDANIRLLKGEGHPMFSARERRYVAGSIRHVHRALVSSGRGWMDAAPEIDLIRPDVYAVNEDGDRPEKRAFCEERGLEYVVLERVPRKGLPRRDSTHLRGY